MSQAIAPSCTVVKVSMAGIGYGGPDETLETLLGSCVGVAIWDRESRQCALAHVVLSYSTGNSTSPGKFADTAIVAMRRELLARAADPNRLVAKIAGGSRMFGPATTSDVGTRNIEAVRKNLDQFNIRVLAEHLGGTKGRVIRVHPRDFSIEVMVAREVAAVI